QRRTGRWTRPRIGRVGCIGIPSWLSRRQTRRKWKRARKLRDATRGKPYEPRGTSYARRRGQRTAGKALAQLGERPAGPASIGPEPLPGHVLGFVAQRDSSGL